MLVGAFELLRVAHHLAVFERDQDIVADAGGVGRVGTDIGALHLAGVAWHGDLELAAVDDLDAVLLVEDRILPKHHHVVGLVLDEDIKLVVLPGNGSRGDKGHQRRILSGHFLRQPVLQHQGRLLGGGLGLQPVPHDDEGQQQRYGPVIAVHAIVVPQRKQQRGQNRDHKADAKAGSNHHSASFPLKFRSTVCGRRPIYARPSSAVSLPMGAVSSTRCSISK